MPDDEKACAAAGAPMTAEAGKAGSNVSRGISLLLRVLAGTALFVVVLATVQARDPRTAGMMLTFPVLNGISLMLAPVADKRAMARAMLAVIALNGIVGLMFIGAFSALAASIGANAAAIVWPLSAGALLVWLLIIAAVSRWRSLDRAILLGFLIAAPFLAALWWTACPAGGSAAAFSMASQSVRILLFALSLGMLLAVSEWMGAGHALVGRLGAFPVLPLFSLATIAETAGGAARLEIVRPAMLIGLALAMTFAWIYSGFLMRWRARARSDAVYVSGALAALVAGWLSTAGLIFGGMEIVAYLEGCG